MAVRGATAAEREKARQVETVQNRVRYYATEIKNAANGRQRLGHACRFAKAVGDELDDVGRTALAKEIADAADRWNKALLPGDP